jgi:hypothetical protein
MSRPRETAPLVEGVQPVADAARPPASGSTAVDDRLVVEAPLEILLHHATSVPREASFGTTLRTPGRDEDLAGRLAVWRGRNRWLVRRRSDRDVDAQPPTSVNVRFEVRCAVCVTATAAAVLGGSRRAVCVERHRSTT